MIDTTFKYISNRGRIHWWRKWDSPGVWGRGGDYRPVSSNWHNLSYYIEYSSLWMELVKKWLLCNVKWAVFQLYHAWRKQVIFNEMMMMFALF